jgi:hypothetical protein
MPKKLLEHGLITGDVVLPSGELGQCWVYRSPSGKEWWGHTLANLLYQMDKGGASRDEILSLTIEVTLLRLTDDNLETCYAMDEEIMLLEDEDEEADEELE